jgi:CRP-like cAMP-binding protein
MTDPVLRNSLLAALPPEEQQALVPHLETVHLARGTVLAEAGDALGHVYFPYDGVVSGTLTMRDGGTAEIATIGCEGMVGIGVVLGHARAITRNVVQVEGKAARLPTAELEAASARSAAVRALCLSYAMALLFQVMQSSACNALHPTEQRLCRWLLLLLHDRAGEDTLRLTQEFLAEMLGVCRPTVTLVARNLQAAGLIRYHRGTIEILDRAGLEEVSCECYRAVRAQYERLLPTPSPERPLS